MATVEPKQFMKVEELSSFKCGNCQKVPTVPFGVDCCEAIFCQDCLDEFKDKKPCPKCNESDFNSLRSPREKKRIADLQLYCNMKGKGCEWEGTLEQLADHLEECEYTECSLCEQGVAKTDLDDHQQHECPQREHTCEYCDFTSTYENVSEHLNECPHLECELQYIGCKEKVPRQETDDHMTQSTQHHIILLGKECKKMRQDFDELLQKKDETIQDLKQQLAAMETQRANEREDDKNEWMQRFKENDSKLQETLRIERDRDTQRAQQRAEDIKRMEEKIKQMLEENNQTMKQEMKDLCMKPQYVSDQIETALTKAKAITEEAHKQLSTELQAKESKIAALEEKLEKAAKKVQEDIDKQAKATTQVQDTMLAALKKSHEEFQSQLDARESTITEKLEAQESSLEETASQTTQLQVATQARFKELYGQLKKREDQANQAQEAVEAHVIQSETELHTMIETSESNFAESLKQATELLLQNQQETNRLMEDKHIETNAQIKATNDGIRDLAVKIGKNDAEITQLKNNLSHTHTLTEEVKANTKQLEVAFYKDKEQILKLSLASGVPPFYIEMAGLSEMTFEGEWVSPYMHTHPHGYKFAIGVTINADTSSDGNIRITTFFWATKGEYDGLLRWPARVQLRLELLDQYGGTKHEASGLVTFEWFKTSHPKKIRPTISDGVYAKGKYLRRDTLRFRIADIQLLTQPELNESNVSRRSI